MITVNTADDVEKRLQTGRELGMKMEMKMKIYINMNMDRTERPF